MGVTYEEARELLQQWTISPSLRKHARAVELVMRAAATRYGDRADPERWAIVGLVHDADYEKWPEEHPEHVVQWLREQGEDELAYAVSFHQTKWGLTPRTTMDRALLACDELAGFVMACALVRPEGIATLTPKSVKKKLKDKAFAAKVDRDIIHEGVELLGVDLTEHIAFIIDVLKPHAEELELQGTGA
jgi:predicted hydrolase (HD superfamily)